MKASILIFLCMVCLANAATHQQRVRGVRSLQPPMAMDENDDPQASSGADPKAKTDPKMEKAKKEEKMKKDSKKKDSKKGKSTKSAVKGTVREDTDLDGTGDRPLPNVKVLLKDEQDNTLDSTVTDRSGNYDFSSLNVGEYAVVDTTNTTCEETTFTNLQDVDTLLPGDATITEDSRGDETTSVVEEYPSTVTLICTSQGVTTFIALASTGVVLLTTVLAWM